MPSLVWGRDPVEAFNNPYEYGMQKQFNREAKSLLFELYKAMIEGHRYTRSDCTPQKAIWMLQVDAIDSLRDCLDCLDCKKHRIAAKLFRDAIETMDLAAYFSSATPESLGYLADWFSDTIVPHRVYRDYIKGHIGEKAFQQSRDSYASLSKFTHRSYRAICDGYTLAPEDRIVHDRITMAYSGRDESDTFMVAPHIISSYYATLALIILNLLPELSARGSLTQEQVDLTFQKAMEPETDPRRFEISNSVSGARRLSGP